ncbi:hypothetical protein NHX12_023883 [Muraenolepis orangiensis]|uniref:Uncharacterized protein n=1 Tax=Muraenolepis orangiensis TaxID=630683 RepID=A0A9Q0EL61_9TELE|nr:hypothetical protein NHX12_023883 [Muraenolepis orangiensis]
MVTVAVVSGVGSERTRMRADEGVSPEDRNRVPLGLLSWNGPTDDQNTDPDPQVEHWRVDQEAKNRRKNSLSVKLLFERTSQAA